MTNHSNPNNNNPSELAGLPKSVGLGEQKKRFSAQVAAGHAHIEGDMTLGKKCITALRSGGEFTRATQNFHAYPARLHPEAGRLLLEALPGKTLADPFCGGGTILVEALIAGRTVFGSDLNPIATLVTTARTALLSPEQLQRLKADLDDICARADEKLAKGANVHLPPTILKYKDWYKTNCFNELACLYNEIDKRQSELKPLYQAVFSSLVVKYSLRASDTSNKVVYIPRKNGAVLRAFKDKSEEYVKQLAELQTLVPPNTPPATISLADARHPGFDKVDTIITSPPYPGTYDYLALQQLRQAWFGLDMKTESEIGSRHAFKHAKAAYASWLKDTDKWIAASANALLPGGHLAVVVGEGMQGGKRLRVANPTIQAANRAGLKLLTSASVDRFDPATKIKKVEYILVFEKEGL